MATTITVPSRGAVDSDLRDVATAAANDINALQAGTSITGVNGVTMPAGGALTTGTVLRATGAAAAAYGALDLANASAVTGTLPKGNQGAQDMAGDVTGTTAASVVAKVNGATVPAAGALTTGNVPQVSGVSALTYGPINLAGGANYVTGTLPAANLPLQVSQVTLVAGTATVNAGITITAASRVIPVLVTPGAGASGTRYAISGLTVGGAGVGAFTVTAKDSGAGDNTVATDVSVLDCIIIG